MTKIYLLLLILLFSTLVNAQDITILKTDYLLEEVVLVNINERNLRIEILSPTNLYRYLGTPDTELKFFPKEIGSYEIRVKDSNDEILQVTQFKVGNGKQLPKANVFSRFRIKNSNSQLLYSELDVYDSAGQLVASTNSFDPVILQNENYDVELKLNRDSIQNIKFNNFKFDGQFDLGFEELNLDAVQFPNKKTNKVYAIDPTSLDFDDAVVTGIAQGTELYKCKDYNFAEQECFGDFVKILDLIPGEEYSFILTPEDPLYTEQTSDTIDCTCTNTCQTSPGSSSQCTATCNDYCDISFTMPPGAISGWLEKVHYDITLILSTTGSPVSGSHEGRLDKDETPNSVNDVQIGTSSESAEATHTFTYENNNLDDSGPKSFDDNSCATWDSGYCTWKPYLYTEYTCQGSNKRCTTSIQLDLINYTWNYTADEENPTLTINNPENNSFTNSVSNTFYYTPNDNLALENCSIYINGEINQTNSSLTKAVETTFKINNMDNDQFSWYLTCFDTSGNSNTSATSFLTVDALNPAISYIDPTLVNNSHISVDFITINVSHTELYPDILIFNWNGSQEVKSYFGSYTNISRSSLSDGVYTYYVYVNDSASNANQTETRTITIDLTDPTVSLNDPYDHTWINYNTSIVFNFTPSDTNLENCSLYGNFTGVYELNQTKNNPVTDVKNNFDPVNIVDGVYVWNVRCLDKSGRNGWAASNYTVKVDAALPIVTLLNPENNTYWNNSIVNFNYSVTDNFDVNNCTLEIISNISTYYYENDTVQIEVMSFTETLANNRYNWTVYCTDPAGNTNNPEFFNLTVEQAEDTVGPSVTPNSPQNNNWTNINNVTIFYTPSDISDINNCSLYIGVTLNQTDDFVENNMQNNFSLNYLNEGSYRWFVKCYDNSTNYNEGQSSAYRFYVDLTIPNVNLEYPMNYFNTTDNGINITWTATDNMANTMYCDLLVNLTLEGDDITTSNNTLTNQTASFVDDGSYYWNVTCRDLAYNYQSSETRYFTKDATPPIITLNSPSNSNITTTGNITFFYIPTDNTSGLDYCNLYINGIFNQSDYNLLNNQQNYFSTNNTASGNYDWQINCTDNFGLTGNSTVWSYLVDVDAPNTNSYEASPVTVDLNQYVNLTVNVTDNYGVSAVIAQIINPVGSVQNYSMTQSTDIYNLTFTDTTLRGSYTVNIISNDTYGNKNISHNYYFFVQPGISIDKIYYDREEQVQIRGEGYDSADNITINVSDSINNLVPGFPITLIANSSGGFYYQWNITNSSASLTGNYSVLAYDTFTSGQSGTQHPYLVRKSNAANRFDKNNLGDNVNAVINESDDTRVTLVTSSNEDYINVTWIDIVPIGQIVSDIRLYIEHIESADYNLFVEWYNSTGAVWKTICTIVASTATEVIDTCDLNDEVIRSADANDMHIQITDNDNYGSSIGAWTNIDFVYFEVQFTTLTTDKDLYQQGENVTILGSNWPENKQLTIDITRPGSITDQEFATTNAFGEFTSIYQVPYNGSLGQYNVTVYLTEYPDDVDTTTFEVVKRNSSITTDKVYYGRTETLLISGKGFSSYGNISVLIYDAQNILRVNATANASGHFNGTIAFNWTIPYNYQGYYGLHTISIKDKLYPNLNGTSDITVGILSDTSIRVENSITTDITNLVNQSDNVTASLAIYNGIEDYIKLQLLDGSPLNYVLINITLYIEHNETQNFDLVLEWWNESSWIDVCSITYSSSELFSNCDLLSLIQRSLRTSNVTLKITDNQTDFGSPGQDWTFIDYIYLVTWSEPDTINPEVEIILPDPDFIYNYSQQVLIQVNVSDNVQLDTVFANITWLDYSEIVTLNPDKVNYFGDGIYEGYFPNTTDLGLYNITIFSNDMSSNFNYTEKTNFTIGSPDLTSNSTYLLFSNNNPVEGENITINLTIFNYGNTNASSFIVQFYKVNYSGQQINGDIIVTRLDIGKNITVNITWIAEIGSHNIQAAIDTPINTNGSIWETNESNNIVNKQIFVPAYHIYYGNSSGIIRLDKDTSESKYRWNYTNEGNIYVVETGSDISWLDLQSLSRNTSNLSTIGDFYEADVALNMTNLTDSINETYSVNNLPKATKNFTVYERIIRFVPIVNSTNTTNFVTGILYDTSDLAILEYNGTQDLVFLTEVNANLQGKYGVYDYELKVPAHLDSYKIGSGTVTFYTEIE